jgi:hypothetical protein
MISADGLHLNMRPILAIVVLTALFVFLSCWRKATRLRTAAHWPTAQVYVAQIEEKRDENGFVVVTLAYTYKVEGLRYVGRESFSFIQEQRRAAV